MCTCSRNNNPLSLSGSAKLGTCVRTHTHTHMYLITSIRGFFSYFILRMSVPVNKSIDFFHHHHISTSTFRSVNDPCDSLPLTYLDYLLPPTLLTLTLFQFYLISYHFIHVIIFLPLGLTSLQAHVLLQPCTYKCTVLGPGGLSVSPVNSFND